MARSKLLAPKEKGKEEAESSRIVGSSKNTIYKIYTAAQEEELLSVFNLPAPALVVVPVKGEVVFHCPL